MQPDSVRRTGIIRWYWSLHLYLLRVSFLCTFCICLCVCAFVYQCISVYNDSGACKWLLVGQTSHRQLQLMAWGFITRALCHPGSPSGLHHHHQHMDGYGERNIWIVHVQFTCFVLKSAFYIVGKKSATNCGEKMSLKNFMASLNSTTMENTRKMKSKGNIHKPNGCRFLHPKTLSSSRPGFFDATFEFRLKDIWGILERTWGFMFYNMGYSSLNHFTAVKTQDKEETFGLWTLNMDNLFLLTHVQKWYFLFMKSSTSGEKVLQSARPTEGGGG